jgi:DNA-binding IclR family transcriptional regulator
VVRVCDLLDALQANEDGLGFAELVAAVNMPKSSALRYLATLES